ncbi:MAG: glycosyltransferase [Sphingobacteriales bacterium]|nr:MAG: glycosyltransferase [Sphingobacteriales bacterium]TAF79956.1 MAG: glycosyltransferase [Sphingobacteriales bacterium]
MSKLISVITINLNNKTGLQKTINSVLRQTYPDFEFIIIDGNSTDGSKHVIESNKKKLSYYISEPDKGIYNAMNKGITAANGKYLLFLNSGDLLNDATTLERVSENLCGKFGIYYGNANYLETNGEIIRTYPSTLSFSFFLQQNLSHQASFIEKKLFYTFFLYNETYKIVSDWEFFIYTICKENVLYKHLDLVICKYNTLGVSSSNNNQLLMNNERQKTLKKYFPLFIDDYKFSNELNTKRGKQFILIKTHAIGWKLLKGFMNLILLFLPKKER